MVPKRLYPNTNLGVLLVFCYMSLIPILCLLLSCGGQSQGAEPEPEPPYAVLVVFHDPNCRRCKEDEHIVDYLRGVVEVMELGWSDKEAIKELNLKSTPTYVLLIVSDGTSWEVWRTNSAAVALYRLVMDE